MLTALIVKTVSPCAVSMGGAFSVAAPETPLVLPVPPDGDVFLSVWDAAPGDGAFTAPALIRIKLEGGRAMQANNTVIDWGDVLETVVAPLKTRLCVPKKPALLDTADFVYLSKPARAELYSDNGLGLALVPRSGAAAYFSLGEGENGDLRVIDLGSARVLVVTADTDSGTRVVAVGQDAEIMLDEKGSGGAGIADGLLYVVERLDSVRGLERRTRFEYVKGGFTALAPELGFFTRDRHEPANDAERAVAAAEDVLFGLMEGRGLLSEELSESLGEGSLGEFLGEFKRVFVHPIEEREGRVTLGLSLDEGPVLRPRRFVFVFENGLISDIEES